MNALLELFSLCKISSPFVESIQRAVQKNVEKPNVLDSVVNYAMTAELC